MYKQKIGPYPSQLYIAFYNYRYIDILIDDDLSGLTHYMKIHDNIEYIDNHEGWSDDELVFESEADYFLFLLKYS